jgi:hypothetical protein
MPYAPPVRRVNRGRGHSYVDANGAKVPGVTTIMGNGVPKPALINWAANTTAGYAIDHWDELTEMSPSVRLAKLKEARYADRDAAANRGTAVHALAEKLVHGEEVTVPDELAGHVESYVRFLDEWDVQPVLTEFVVVSHKRGYAGTGDLIADLVDPDRPGERVRWLLDVKTSRSGVYGETALQLAGYRYADFFLNGAGHEETVPVVQRTGVIHVRADGYDLVPVEAGPDQFRALLYVQQVANFCAESRDLVGDALLPPALQESM